MRVFIKNNFFYLKRDLVLRIGFQSCLLRYLFQQKMALPQYGKQTRIPSRNPQVFNSYAPIQRNMEPTE